MDTRLLVSSSSLSVSSSMRSRPETMAWTAASSSSRQIRTVIPSLKLKIRLRSPSSRRPEAWRSGKLAPKLVSVFLNDENDESCAGFYSLTLRK